MSQNIYWLLVTTVREGKLESVKELMEEMVTATKDNEPGAIDYDWSISDDQKTLVLFERYKDAGATMIHLDGFGKNYAKRFMSLLEVKSFNVFGDVNDDVRRALGAAGAKVFNHLGGFQR